MGLRKWFKYKQQSKNNDTILLYFVAFDERTTHFKFKKKKTLSARRLETNLAERNSSTKNGNTS